MQFEKTIRLSASPEVVWSEVSDLAVLAACLPGARLDAVESDRRASGHLTVRVGSVRASFEGTAEMAELDPARRALELRATGRGGQGTAEATVDAQVTEEGDHSTLSMQIAVEIAGPLARLGQGMAEPVVDRLIDRFAAALGAHLESIGQPSGQDVPTHGDAIPTTRSTTPPAPDDALDLGSLLPPGLSMPLLLTVGAALLVLVVIGRRGRRPMQPTTIVVALMPPSSAGWDLSAVPDAES